MQLKFAILSLSLGLAAQSVAAGNTVHSHLGTADQQMKAKIWNRTHMRPLAKPDWNVDRPFSEVEKTGYVAVSGDNNFELADLREAIAKNLPADAVMVIFVGDSSDVPAMREEYSKYLGADRLKFLVVPMNGSSDPIWARDSLPFPVHMKNGGFGLVDSLYPQDFEPDSAFAKAMSLPMVETGEYFRGGNFLIDSKQNCYSENVNETGDLNDPQTFFTRYFGCASVNLLDQEGGIGDIDERIKFLSGNDVLTDNDTYAKILQDKGYSVHRIPSTGRNMETYMNTLIVNGTIFVPQMHLPSDQSALDAYTALGLKAVGVFTKDMADEGHGNIHCVTMNYPPGSFTGSARGTDFVEFSR
jgi:hypothetical protein